MSALLSPPSLRLWTAAQIAGNVAIVAASVLAVTVYTEITKNDWQMNDARWAAFELGFEYQRLLLAAERGDSLEEIRTRGDIYLSRVMILRDAPHMAALRERVQRQEFDQLLASAQDIDREIAGLARLEQRDGLLWRLRADAPMVRALMLELAKLDRKINRERRAALDHNALIYLLLLEGMLLALLGLCALVFTTSWKLRETGRELAVQLASRDQILRTVDTVIIGLAPGGEVLYSNPRAVTLFGSDAERGRTFPPPEEAAGLSGEIAALLGAATESGHCKVEHRTPDGTRHFTIRISRCGQGAAAVRILAMTDVTVEEEAALRREEYDLRLAEASRLLAYASLAGGIVHEISQPLAAVRNYAYALQVSLGMRQSPDQVLPIAEHLGTEVDRAIEVVRNVRRLGPAESQETEACDLNEAIGHSIRLVSLGATPAPPITVSSSARQVLVPGSLPMIGQVVVNLLKNALSASAAAGRAGAEVRVTVDRGMAEIAIADFGDGVSAEAAHGMFAPFARSERGGMGLGLAISLRIAQSLGGSLSWENGESLGAVFRFRIPHASRREAA